MKYFFSMSFIVLVFLNLAGYSNAQYIEIFAIGQQMKGDKTTASEIILEVADNTAFGFGAGFNIDHFNLNLDLLFGATEVKVDATKMNTSLSLFDANIDYAPLKASFSPIVTAGIGSVTFSDSFIKIEKLNETDLSYNIGIGLKWFIFKHYLFKSVYKATWTKIKGTDDPIMFRGISLNLGYVF